MYIFLKFYLHSTFSRPEFILWIFLFYFSNLGSDFLVFSVKLHRNL
jgi:hypothetical protein